MKADGQQERVRDLSAFTEAEQQWLIEVASRKPKRSPEQLALVRRIFRPCHHSPRTRNSNVTDSSYEASNGSTPRNESPRDGARQAIESPWMTVDEAKAYARMGKNQIYDACRTRKLKARQTVAPQGKWLIHRDDLDVWLRSDRR